MESMENPNLEIKKFTKENPCECGYPNSIDHHQENCIHYEKEGKEFGDARTENEEKNISDEEYIRERKRSFVESPVVEEKKEDLWAKEAKETKGEGKIKASKIPEKKLEAQKNDNLANFDIKNAVMIAREILQREIDFGLSGKSIIRLMDKSDEEIKKWLEKSLCRAIEAAIDGQDLSDRKDLLRITGGLTAIKAPERIKEIFLVVLKEYISKV